jgi:hypothetical protein
MTESLKPLSSKTQTIRKPLIIQLDINNRASSDFELSDAPPEDDGVPEALELKDAAGSDG